MKKGYSLMRCIAGIVAAVVAVSAFSGCGSNSVSIEGNESNASESAVSSADELPSDYSESNSVSMGDNESEGAVNSADELPPDYMGNRPTPGASIAIDTDAVEPSYTYPTIWEVLPRIDKTPVSKFKYRYDASLGGMAITDYLGASPKIYIPDTIEGEPVVSADLGNVEVTHLIMPKTLVELRCNTDYIKYANYPNSDINLGKSLEAVYIEPTVKTIGHKAFSECPGLTSVAIPGSVELIDGGAFCRCKNLSSVKIFHGVTRIGNGAFLECKNLSSVIIPDTVVSMGYNVFEDCSSLSSITLPRYMEVIGSEAFLDCSSLTSIEFPAGISVLSYSMFSGCTNLSSIILSNDVTTIGDDAFHKCTKLSSITIPDSVTDFGEDIFGECTSLTSITYQGKTYSVDEFYDAGFTYEIKAIGIAGAPISQVSTPSVPEVSDRNSPIYYTTTWN